MSASHSTTPGGAPPAGPAEPAVALYRISDDKQDSLPTQRAWAQRVAQTDRLALAGEFEDEGVSGSDVNRPGLEDLIAFVEKRFYDREPVRHLLTLDLDRFSRRDSLSTGAWLEQLRRHGLRWIITTSRRYDLHNALDRTLIALGSDFTREPELRAKSNHVLNGMAERARRGLWMGGPVPYGYRLGDDGKLTPGPEDEQETVRWIFATYAAGRLTANGIARALNARGVRPRLSKSGTWSRNTVLKMLASRNYLGCIVWGEQRVGKYHQLRAGLVVPREDKEDREQHQLLHRLKHLPVALAGEEDCIVCPDAHPSILDDDPRAARALFDACQARREQNRGDRSAPRGEGGNVWPLAGQMKCGHCGAPLWTLPVSAEGGRRRGDDRERARVCCSERKKDPGACPRSAAAAYLDVLGRVVALLRKRLASPAAVAEMEAELRRQLAEHDQAGRVERPRMQRRADDLDAKIAEAVANLAHTPEDLRADVAEYVRKLKADREELGREMRDLDARRKESAPIDPAEFRQAVEVAGGLTADVDTREEAELLRATLRDLVAEARVYFRPRLASDPKPPRGIAPARVIARVEVDLTPSFADLLTAGNRSSRFPRTW